MGSKLKAERGRPPSEGAHYCRECSAWRPTRVCPVCWIDLVTLEPAEPEFEQAAGRVGAPSAKAFFKVAWGEVLPSLPGALLSLVLVWITLSSKALDFGLGPFHAPGQLLATFVCMFWLLDRTRSATTHGTDLDPTEIAATLLRTLFLFPLAAGLAAGYVTAWPIALVMAPLLPLVLGPLACNWRELTPHGLWHAFRATANYSLFALGTTASLYAGLFAVWFAEGRVSWRAPLAVLGVTVAGTLAGLARRGAEQLPEETDLQS